MDGTLVVQVHLLAHMRAVRLVETAYQRLELAPAALVDCRSEAVRRGLAEPGHPMDIYTDLLGKPLVQECIDDADPYRRRRCAYLLPLWPDLVFVVQGSESGETGGLTFACSRLAAAPPALTAARPWRLVEEQVVEWPALRVTDEWYPMKDYQVLIQVEEGAWAGYVLQFDYGLLQAAVRL